MRPLAGQGKARTVKNAWGGLDVIGLSCRVRRYVDDDGNTVVHGFSGHGLRWTVQLSAGTPEPVVSAVWAKAVEAAR